MTLPNLTPTRRTGDARCGSRDTDDSPICGAPATWHVAWRLAPDAEFSLVCDKHMTQAQKAFVYADRHTVDVACDMPGTGWAIGNPSFCVLPPDDADREFLTERAQPPHDEGPAGRSGAGPQRARTSRNRPHPANPRRTLAVWRSGSVCRQTARKSAPKH